MPSYGDRAQARTFWIVLCKELVGVKYALLHAEQDGRRELVNQLLRERHEIRRMLAVLVEKYPELARESHKTARVVAQAHGRPHAWNVRAQDPIRGPR